MPKGNGTKNLRVSLAVQQRVLELHESGKTIDEISWELRLHRGILDAIIKRGMPTPRKSRPRRCGGCGSLIVTDYCIGCLIEAKKNARRLCGSSSV